MKVPINMSARALALGLAIGTAGMAGNASPVAAQDPDPEDCVSCLTCEHHPEWRQAGGEGVSNFLVVGDGPIGCAETCEDLGYCDDDPTELLALLQEYYQTDSREFMSGALLALQKTVPDAVRPAPEYGGSFIVAAACEGGPEKVLAFIADRDASVTAVPEEGPYPLPGSRSP